VRRVPALSVAATLAPAIGRPDTSEITPANVNVRAAGSGRGSETFAAAVTEPGRPLSSDQPTVSVTDDPTLKLSDVSLSGTTPKLKLSPGLIRIGAEGSALALAPVPNPKRIVVTDAAVRPLVSVMVKDAR